jgi:hypothetical protein
MSDIKSIANNPFTQYVKRVLGPDVVIPATDKEWDVFLIIAIYTNEYIYNVFYRLHQLSKDDPLYMRNLVERIVASGAIKSENEIKLNNIEVEEIPDLK